MRYLIANLLIFSTIGANSPIHFRGMHPVRPAPDGNIYLEAEEFTPEEDSDWKAKPWGENYYAATFANSFLSRKGFLGAPEQTDKSIASLEVEIANKGLYMVLVRYEAAYRFETQFRVEVEQEGKLIFNRLYGARKNLKIWAFNQKVRDELAWSWGASENIVWEGHKALVGLNPGRAKIRLIADSQPEPAARRNVDLVMLTKDHKEVLRRIEEEKYLPLDGLLTQQGDVFMRFTNLSDKTLQLSFKNGTEHSPYWVHQRTWKPVTLKSEPGQRTNWTEVGHLLDTLNDGQWDLTLEPPGEARIEISATQADGSQKTIWQQEGTLEKLPLAYDANTRYTQRIRDRRTLLPELHDYLQQQPEHGRTPTETLIFANTFKTEFDESYNNLAISFRRKFGITQADNTSGTGDRIDGYIEVRNIRTDKLAEYCTKLGERAGKIATVSMGDEISLSKPYGTDLDKDFRDWLQSLNLKPRDASIGARSWEEVTYNSSVDQRTRNPNSYYWSRRYQHHYGMKRIKERTDILRKHLPNAGIGANYSPHYPAPHRYLGEVHKWVTTFRTETMTQPWSEDYIFQMPICSQQVNNLNLDLLRAGARGRPNQKIHYYCMAHWPSNRPDSWRRLFFGALGHGMQIVNLFEFRPVQVAYTENHVSNKETYATVLKSFRELGTFEHIVQAGRPRQAKTALWFSETSDIWGDNNGSFAAGKRTLYTAIRHQEVPLDTIVEADAIDGTLNEYKVLYLCDRHVSNAAAERIAHWVETGGTLFVTAGAGMFDEYNAPNRTLRKLIGADLDSIEEPEDSQVSMVKQDLPFAEPITSLQWQGGKLETFGAQARLTVRNPNQSLKANEIRLRFPDGSPALLYRPQGKGKIYTCAFLPGLSYYRGATPKRPVDRSSSEDSLVHFLPTQFNEAARQVIDLPTQNLLRPVRSSAPLVESCILDSPKGTAIVLVNWTRKPRKSLTLILDKSFPEGPVRLASGGAVNRSGNRITLDLDIADALIFSQR